MCPWLTVPSLASLPKLLDMVPTLGGLTNLKPAMLLVAWVMFIDSTRSIMVFSEACRTLGLAKCGWALQLLCEHRWTVTLLVIWLYWLDSRLVSVRSTGLTGRCRIPVAPEHWETWVELGLIIHWTLGMASEALVIPAVTMTCRRRRDLNIPRRLVVDSCVNSGTTLTVLGWCTLLVCGLQRRCSVVLNLRTLCLLEVKIRTLWGLCLREERTISLV